MSGFQMVLTVVAVNAGVLAVAFLALYLSNNAVRPIGR